MNMKIYDIAPLVPVYTYCAISLYEFLYMSLDIYLYISVLFVFIFLTS